MQFTERRCGCYTEAAIRNVCCEKVYGVNTVSRGCIECKTVGDASVDCAVSRSCGADSIPGGTYSLTAFGMNCSGDGKPSCHRRRRHIRHIQLGYCCRPRRQCCSHSCGSRNGGGPCDRKIVGARNEPGRDPCQSRSPRYAKSSGYISIISDI